MIRRYLKYRSAPCGGFTLLEVLVALAVLSIVVLASVRNSGVLSDNSSVLKERTLAHFVAMNKAAELRLAKELLLENESKGYVFMAGEEWQWQIFIKATGDRDIRKAEITVSRVGEGEENLSAFLTAYLGRSYQ